MTEEKDKKKLSWKERRRRAALKHQRALKAERVKREKPSEGSKRWSRSRILVITLLTLIVLGAGVYGVWLRAQPSQPSNGDELPPLYTLTDAEFSELRGKVVVLDCFATWCAPCKAEIPELAEIDEKYDGSEVVVISVGSSTDSERELRQFKKDYNMDWLVARDTVGVLDKYSVSAIPTIVILDRNGNIHYRHEGFIDASALSSKIDELSY